MIIVIFALIKIYSFKADNKNLISPTLFSLRNIFEKIDYAESEEASFKGNVYDF